MEAFDSWERGRCRVELFPMEYAENPRHDWDAHIATFVTAHRDYELGGAAQDRDITRDQHARDMITGDCCYRCGADVSYETRGQWWRVLVDGYGETWCDDSEEGKVTHAIGTIAQRLAALDMGTVVGPVMPLYLYDHSGISMSTSSGMFRAIDSAAWDWGTVGIAFVTREQLREVGHDDAAIDALDDETIARWISGEVELFDAWLTGDVCGYVVTADGDEADSCWGYYGDDGRKAATDDANAAADSYNADADADDAADREQWERAHVGEYA